MLIVSMRLAPVRTEIVCALVYPGALVLIAIVRFSLKSCVNLQNESEAR